MDARLLHYYNQEPVPARTGQRVRAEFPNRGAARHGGLEVTDPYVERLLEGSAFTAARVRFRLDAGFRFSHRLLELLCPGTAPLPSMLVARISPVPDADLLQGHAWCRATASCSLAQQPQRHALRSAAQPPS
jgi:type VI secretion system protein ImpG